MPLCTASGERLEAPASVEIPGPGPAAELTARFESVPDEHDGGTIFEVHLVFNEVTLAMKNGRIKRALRITGGETMRVHVVDGDRRHRRIRIRPHGVEAVSVSLESTTDCADAHAFCTASGAMLGTGIETSVPGPVAISVADAHVEEAQGAVLEFEVTLDRARIRQWLAVDYATEDGTATAGVDYTATSGSLVFAAGETAKTVSVAVINDAHDEGSETMVLRLSNPLGARIADGEATGTIKNDDPMPQAWLARFGAW